MAIINAVGGASRPQGLLRSAWEDHPPPPRSLRAHGLAQRRQGLAAFNWFVFEFWRFQFVQQEVGKLAQTAIEFPPMQKGAFNLEAVKEQITAAMKSRTGN